MPKELSRAASCLQRAYQADPEAINALVKHRVPCNARLADDPTVVTGPTDSGYDLGPIGLLNGVLAELGEPCVAYIHDSDGRILGFQNYEPPTR